ncbi:acetyl-CoA synthetase-like protein [Dothidotthia symphoricarpi CBS 119687]|uniref:Acetyl-CoA synthetase-like protein n=1 Tax=Dothidotthia symphoricarpi CBS 119687 TaxID=1392245 RepID=A0A6A6A4M1_9PLEO|nr:acetyl-CoA synthetase-like protein [Dothidotthia symphoricarpi CBS 119687]KAF2126750.1 acetyl-CoA synthetase-like protein [Dothidotthia symphoricarpi CBS 119687]
MAFWSTVLNASSDTPYGRRLVCAVIDENADLYPDKVCYSIPYSEDLRHGFRDVNWRTYANAIDRMAHLIEKEIGRSSVFATVMYLGYPDLRNFIVPLALIKTGHKVLFSSPRNSIIGHSELIRQTDCKILLHTAGFPISGILEKCPMKTICVPELEFLLTATPRIPYPYNKSFEDAKNDPCLIVHTSGSTGIPKPTVWTNWSISTTDNYNLVAPLEDRPTLWAADINIIKRNYCAWSIFNGAGLAASIMMTCFSGKTIVLGPPEQQTTVDTFNDMLDYANIDSACCLPSVLEDIARRPDILVKLNRLRMLAYVGGSIPSHVGETIYQHTHLYTVMGSAETITIVQHVTDREDWPYVCINPTCNGIEMRPVADLFELVYVKNPHFIGYQGIFKVFPKLQEYSMQDLYSRHPTKAHHWKYEGRKDDVIVLRNGWNFNPMLHERTITLHPYVQRCMVVGTSREKPAAIIQLKPEYYTDDEMRQKAILESIWPQVVRANNICDDYGQIEQRYIIFAKKEKPFFISLKDTVQRKTTIHLYSQEIDDLYDSIARAGLRGLFQTER